MKQVKGDQGYIEAEKKARTLRTAGMFGIILLLLIIGYIVTGTRLNWFTFAAIMLCLPGAKMLVGVITIFPHHSLAVEKAEQLKKCSGNLMMVYETIMTSQEKIMPVDAFAISDNTICGYSGNTKLDIAYAADYVKTTLRNNRYTKVSVKLFDDFDAFVKRTAEMNELAENGRPDCRDKEDGIKKVLLAISL